MNANMIRNSALAAAILAGTAAQAQIPATAPYNTDPVNEYVQDDTAQGISSLNMVLCVIGSMDPGDMVNAGPYLALVDVNKCQSKGGSAASAGATNYANAIVDVTRASNSDPMIAKVWLSLTEQGNASNVYAYLTATQSPTAAPPYGVFRMDYIGKKNGLVGFNGYIDSQPGVIKFLETGAQSSGTALAMTASSTTSGAGTMQVGGGNGQPLSTFNFAYDPGFFRRSDGTNDKCFDRSKANASVSVWQYGTYDATTGVRVDQANPGFPILATSGGTTYYGFANYWGINFQGLDIPDGQPVTGVTVTDQRPGNTTTYALNKVGGKLTQWTRNATTLGALDGIPFTMGADLTNQTNNAGAVTGWGNWVVQWSSANSNFTVTVQQVCGSNGCVASALTGNATAVISSTFLNTSPIIGWSDSFGGNLTIPATGSAHATTDPVLYYTQATMLPGAAGAPAALYCLSQCPTAASIGAAFVNGGGSASPFGNSTGQQWFSANSANTVAYTFGATGLAESGTPIVLESPSQYPTGSTFAQNGVQTGRLFASALSLADCPAGLSAPTVCEPASPATYFTWQTGPNQWSQSLWLTKTSNNSVVAFDPPQNIQYTVPSGGAYGSFAGKSILLQFNGFGNLFGIPGYCVSPVDNSTVDCSTANSRYVPMFSIPDGALMTLPSPATALIVKALNGEIRLGLANSSNCAAMTLTPLTLPSGGTHDPSSASDSEYLGTMPTVTAAPKVIDGVLQP